MMAKSLNMLLSDPLLQNIDDVLLRSNLEHWREGAIQIEVRICF